LQVLIAQGRGPHPLPQTKADFPSVAASVRGTGTRTEATRTRLTGNLALALMRTETDSTTGDVAATYACESGDRWQVTPRRGWQPCEPDGELVSEVVARGGSMIPEAQSFGRFMKALMAAVATSDGSQVTLPEEIRGDPGIAAFLNTRPSGEHRSGTDGNRYQLLSVWRHHHGPPG
jgi:hypothetical protein